MEAGYTGLIMYIPNFFKLHELIPRNTYELFGGDPVLWLLFDPGILRVSDLTRRRYGAMVANTWARDGEHEFRGFRPWDCAVGAQLSQHKFGRGVDLVPAQATPTEIRADIMAGNAPEIASLITGLEMDIPWLHIDAGNRTANHKSGLQLIYP